MTKREKWGFNILSKYITEVRKEPSTNNNESFDLYFKIDPKWLSFAEFIAGTDYKTLLFKRLKEIENDQ